MQSMMMGPTRARRGRKLQVQKRDTSKATCSQDGKSTEQTKYSEGSDSLKQSRVFWERKTATTGGNGGRKKEAGTQYSQPGEEPAQSSNPETSGRLFQDFGQVLPSFSGWGSSASKLFQQVKSRVAEGNPVKFLETVVSQINDATEQVDQIINTWAQPEEPSEVTALSPSLPVSKTAAPVPCEDSDTQIQSLCAAWDDFDFDDKETTSCDNITELCPSLRCNSLLTDDFGDNDLEPSTQRSPLHPNTPHPGSPVVRPTCSANTNPPVQSASHMVESEEDQDTGNNVWSEMELADWCQQLQMQNYEFKEKCERLEEENEKLKSLQNTQAGDGVIAEQLAQQVQSLMQEKAKILQEKEWLQLENRNLQQLLELACASMPRDDAQEVDELIEQDITPEYPMMASEL